MSITYNGQTWTIKRTKEPIGGDRKNRSILGSSEEAENLIIFDGTLPKTRQEEVLLHEIVHVSDMSIPEFIVADIAKNLYGLMTENRLLWSDWMDRIVDGEATILEADMINELSKDIKEAQEEVGIFRMVVDDGPALEGNGFAVAQTAERTDYLLDVMRDGRVNRVACRRAETAMISGAVPPFKLTARQLVELIEVVLQEEPHPALARLARG